MPKTQLQKAQLGQRRGDEVCDTMVGVAILGNPSLRTARQLT
jgi:hypothetical protein